MGARPNLLPITSGRRRGMLVLALLAVVALMAVLLTRRSGGPAATEAAGAGQTIAPTIALPADSLTDSRKKSKPGRERRRKNKSNSKKKSGSQGPSSRDFLNPEQR